MRPSRWTIAPARPDLATAIADYTGLSPLLAQVLINRGIESPEAADLFLDPDGAVLPPPIEEFPDLPLALELLADAIAAGTPIGICGDYDADGMTSTALLLRAFRLLGGDARHAIPSRMRDGYGVNERIVEAFHREGIGLMMTVDNGIAAYDAIAHARDLGLTVIITDHHDVPPQIPPAHAILNPKLINPASPYRGLAGVGVAYVLAVSLGRKLGKGTIWQPLLELFTLGTIADLAPLVGVNRRWVRRGLELIPHSQIPGIRALQQVAGFAVADDGAANLGAAIAPVPAKAPLKPEAIGFRLGPRINAIGRIDDPQTVIELLTTDDPGVALERAMQCEQVNKQRQQLCNHIEQAAITWFEQSEIDLRDQRVLMIVQPDWHHGVIGIVASRLVERYGAPVFIGTYEAHEPDKIRGSARGIPEFDVFAALQYCRDLLGKHGGHRAAGGFSMPAANLAAFRDRLREFGHQCLPPEIICPLVEADVAAPLGELDEDLYGQIDRLHPCGIGNDEPIFWTPNLRVVGQRTIGQDRAHLRLTVADETGQREAIAWRWGDAFPLPERIDLAYTLKENEWKGNVTIELNVVGIRPAIAPARPQVHDQPGSYVTNATKPTVPPVSMDAAPAADRRRVRVRFQFRDRPYECAYGRHGDRWELRIRNGEGNILAVVEGEPTGKLGQSRDRAQEVDLAKPFFRGLVAAAHGAISDNQRETAAP
ncbi:MAG: single-stranded-DNA-specific exonuclease RecJ [Cyanophyceae cyanobacterium]